MNLKEEILQKTNRGLEVFYFYMPIEFVPKRKFRRLFLVHCRDSGL